MYKHIRIDCAFLLKLVTTTCKLIDALLSAPVQYTNLQCILCAKKIVDRTAAGGCCGAHSHQVLDPTTAAV